MMTFILFYWFFSTLFCLGMSWQVSNFKGTKIDIIMAILFGWIMFPISLGIARVQLFEEKKEVED